MDLVGGRPSSTLVEKLVGIWRTPRACDVLSGINCSEFIKRRLRKRWRRPVWIPARLSSPKPVLTRWTNCLKTSLTSFGRAPISDNLPLEVRRAPRNARQDLRVPNAFPAPESFRRRVLESGPPSELWKICGKLARPSDPA